MLYIQTLNKYLKIMKAINSIFQARFKSFLFIMVGIGFSASLHAQTTTVFDVIKNSEAHTTLEAAVVAAELDATLMSEGPFTVFAPTDAAFAALPEGTVATLLEDPTGDLAQILLYHVVAAKAMSTDLSDGQMIATVQGKEVKVTIKDGKVMINNAKVTTANIKTDNGVVHVIDAILMP